MKRTREPRADERGLVGTTIDSRFRVRDVIGEGGAGIVYEADDHAARRRVALKVPILKARNPEVLVKRFLREGRAGAAISHPNVCALYDVGPLRDGTPFLVMERLYGETLAERLERDGALDLVDAINILIQVLAGLDAAHARGIIHRDMKPGNVFLCHPGGYEGFPKILDFGASKAVGGAANQLRSPGDDEVEDLTATGYAVGTPYYMAPEQLRGDREIDGRADVFACGVMFYEMVTGRRPFEGKRAQEVFAKILQAKPPRPREIHPDLPRGVDEVVARVLTREADARLGSAEAFAEALDGLRRASPGAPEPADMPPPDRLAYLRQRYHELSVLYRPSRPPPPPGAPAPELVHPAEPVPPRRSARPSSSPPSSTGARRRPSTGTTKTATVRALEAMRRTARSDAAPSGTAAPASAGPRSSGSVTMKVPMQFTDEQAALEAELDAALRDADTTSPMQPEWGSRPGSARRDDE